MWLTPELQEHLVYWNNPLETGVVFGSVLVLMVAVKYMSLISVVANLGLALVTSTVAFRIYKSVLSAVKKTDDIGHPFKVNIFILLFIVYTFFLSDFVWLRGSLEGAAFVPRPSRLHRVLARRPPHERVQAVHEHCA